jgi:hypothetical protein
MDSLPSVEKKQTMSNQGHEGQSGFVESVGIFEADNTFDVIGQALSESNNY